MPDPDPGRRKQSGLGSVQPKPVSVQSDDSHSIHNASTAAHSGVQRKGRGVVGVRVPTDFCETKLASFQPLSELPKRQPPSACAFELISMMLLNLFNLLERSATGLPLRIESRTRLEGSPKKRTQTARWSGLRNESTHSDQATQATAERLCVRTHLSDAVELIQFCLRDPQQACRSA